METREDIERDAAAWIHKRDCLEWTAADQLQLDQWMQASAARSVVFLRLDSVWRETARVKALGAGWRAGVIPSRAALSGAQMSGLRYTRWAWAAGVLLTVMLPAAWYFAFWSS